MQDQQKHETLAWEGNRKNKWCEMRRKMRRKHTGRGKQCKKQRKSISFRQEERNAFTLSFIISVWMAWNEKWLLRLPLDYAWLLVLIMNCNEFSSHSLPLLLNDGNTEGKRGRLIFTLIWRGIHLPSLVVSRFASRQRKQRERERERSKESGVRNEKWSTREETKRRKSWET